MNEQEWQERAAQMVRAAIDARAVLTVAGAASVYPKGSYRNNTNVLADSDVEVETRGASRARQRA